MKGVAGGVTAVLGIFLAAVLQQSLGTHMAIFHVHPDFYLVFLGTSCLFSQRNVGIWLGFFCGLVYGATAGANLQHYVITRTITGFLAAWSNGLNFQPSYAVAVILTVCVSLFAQFVLMFLAPSGSLTAFVGDTIAGAIYNGLLAVPTYALLRKVLVSPAL